MYVRYFKSGEVFAAEHVKADTSAVRYFRIDEDGFTVPAPDCGRPGLTGEELLASGWEEVPFAEVRQLVHGSLL